MTGSSWSQLTPWTTRHPRRGQLVRIVSNDPIGGQSRFGAEALVVDLDELPECLVGVAVEGYPARTVSLPLGAIVPQDETATVVARCEDERLAGLADGIALRLGGLLDELPDHATPELALRLVGELLDIRRRQQSAELCGSVREAEALDTDRRLALFRLLHGDDAQPCSRCQPEVLRPALWHVTVDSRPRVYCDSCWMRGSRELLADIKAAGE